MNTPKRFLRIKTVIGMVGRSRSAIYRDMRAGTFPAAIQLGARSVGWDSDEIAKWQAERIAASGLAGAAPTKGS